MSCLVTCIGHRTKVLKHLEMPGDPSSAHLRHSDFPEIRERIVVELRGPSGVLPMTWRHEDHHPLARTCQQHAVRVQEVPPAVVLMQVRPPATAEVVEAPTILVEPKVG